MLPETYYAVISRPPRRLAKDHESAGFAFKVFFG